MKFFVTDAQLAALLAEREQSMRQTFTEWFGELEKTRLGELQRVRADRDQELERLADPQGPFVQHLQAEVDFWRMQFRHERQRAEISQDQCRITHQGIGPVSAPPREERLPSQFPATGEQALAGLNLDAM